MTLRRLLIVAMVIAGMGLYVVMEYARIRRAEFDVCRLARQKADREECRRELKLRVAQLKQHDFIEAQVRRLQIDLMKSADEGFVQVAGRLVRHVD